MEGPGTTVTETQEVNVIANIASTSHHNVKAPLNGYQSKQHTKESNDGDKNKSKTLNITSALISVIASDSEEN